MTANLFNVILPEKDQWHILTFGPKTERVSRCWSLLWKKKSTKVLAYHKPQVATFLCNDVKNDGSSCIAWMLNFGSKTFKMLEFSSGIDLLLSHIRYFWFSKMHCQNLTRKKKCWLSFLCYPKILAQNSRFTKKCWISVESPASWSDEKFSSALRRVKISIQHTLLTLISFQRCGITQI